MKIAVQGHGTAHAPPRGAFGRKSMLCYETGVASLHVTAHQVCGVTLFTDSYIYI
jgi:hypothetical protein